MAKLETFYIVSDCIGIISKLGDGSAVSLQLITVGKRHCRLLYIIPAQPELILNIITYKIGVVAICGLLGGKVLRYRKNNQ